MKNHFAFCAVICVLTLAVFVAVPGSVRADAPQDITLSYDAGTQTLSVTVTHKSFFTGLHYVKQVEIKKNNQTVSKNEYSSQPDRKTFSYRYNVPAVENDLLEVTAGCNIQGQKTVTLKVEPLKN